MQIRDLLLFLIGNRGAILRIAQSTSAMWIALLFVLSAGLARNYDTESLLHEPWHALIPLVASTISATALYLIVFGMATAVREKGVEFKGGFRAFLTLFWMTAPMAWLYGVPYEQWVSGPSAVALNLWTLALVSIWRMLLMARVLAVLFESRATTTFPIVALFGNAVIFVLLQFTPLPVFNVMGGIRLTEEALVVQDAVGLVVMLSLVTVPVLFFWSIAAWMRWKPAWALADATIRPPRVAAGPAFALAVLSIVAWLPLLPMMQPAQQRRHEVETMFLDGDVEGAVALMSKHERRDFPPLWEPPPRLSYGERVPDYMTVLESSADLPADHWVRRAYLDKFMQGIDRPFDGFTFSDNARLLSLLVTIPEGRDIATQISDRVRWQLDHNHMMEERDRAALVGLLVLAGQEYADPFKMQNP